MIAVDSSVVVAAFASWHDQHQAAQQALSNGARLAAHSALETYSVLTRLPAPHRAPPELVRDFLAARFPESFLSLDGDSHQTLVAKLVQHGITGGATYDALIATTAASAGATLVSCDRRAAATYERCGARVQLLT